MTLSELNRVARRLHPTRDPCVTLLAMSVAPHNVAVLLTPPGTAALAVVRVGGPLAHAFIASRFSKAVPAGRCVHGELRDESGQVIDDPVVVRVDDSPTFDLSLHGGPWVVRSTLDSLSRFGFHVDPAPALPLPAHAVDTDDPVERDVLTHLPLARTELAVRALLAQRDAWKPHTYSIQKNCDTHESPRPACREDENPSQDLSLWWLLHPPRIAIVGVPNVGKSTLANQLFATERSIVADLPGTTRDWVGDIANLDGLAVMLIDTPGLRDTLDPIEASAIRHATAPIDSADLIILVLDASRPTDDAQTALLARFPDALRVWNKVDHLATPPHDVLSTVATTGQGVDALRTQIKAHFGLTVPYDLHPPRLWTSGDVSPVRRGDEKGIRAGPLPKEKV